MSRTLVENRLWLVALALLIAGAASVCCWQQLQAQGPRPGGVTSTGTPPGATPSAVTSPPAAPQAAEPTVPLGAALPGGTKAIRVKNWDGRVTEILRFKYKTMDRRLITVHLPATYRSQAMTRAGWDTLFQVFAMDQEAALEEKEKGQVQGISAEQMAQFTSALASAANQLASQLSQYAQTSPPSESAYNPASGAMGFARSSLPSMSMQLPPLAPTTPAGAIINP